MDQLYAHYVNGNLPTPAAVMVQSHLCIHPNKHAEVAAIECACAETMCSEDPIEAAPTSLCPEKIMSASAHMPTPHTEASNIAPCTVFPKPLQEFLGYDAKTLPWKPLLPGFWYHPIHKNADGSGAYMFWIKRGKSMPTHKHAGTELTLILQGGISDGPDNFRRGDIAIEYEHSEHRPTAHSDIDCICMAIYDEPIEFTQGLPRLLQRVFQ